MQALLEKLAALIAIDTSNPPRPISADGELVQYLRSVLEPLGFATEVNDYQQGRITFFARRGNPSVLFNVHLDTVPASSGWQRQPWQMNIESERIFGLGACDIKGAAACLLQLAEDQPDLPMALLFSTDEEGSNGCCIEQFCQLPVLQQFQQVVVAEPTGAQAVLAHRGYLSVIGEFRGIAGHSSEPTALENNALHRMSRWASAALQLATEQQDIEKQGYHGICFNLGRIEGGVKSNVIADKASLRFSTRLRPGDVTSQWYAQLTQLPGAEHADWQMPFAGPSLPESEQLGEAARAFALQHDLPLSAGVNFWTEASLFSAAGVPALVLGPGDIAQAHTADEWVEKAQLQAALAAYSRIVQADYGQTLQAAAL